MSETITLPAELVRSRRLEPAELAALVIGLAHEGDGRPLPKLLREEAGFGQAKTRRVIQNLIRLGCVVRKQGRATVGHGWGPMHYHYPLDSHIS